MPCEIAQRRLEIVWWRKRRGPGGIAPEEKGSWNIPMASAVRIGCRSIGGLVKVLPPNRYVMNDFIRIEIKHRAVLLFTLGTIRSQVFFYGYSPTPRLTLYILSC